MALQMVFKDAHRINTTNAYWKLTQFNFDNFQQTADPVFSCFDSEEACNAKCEPLASKSFHLINADFDTVNTLLTQGFKAQAYAFAKNFVESDGTKFFANATDV